MDEKMINGDRYRHAGNNENSSPKRGANFKNHQDRYRDAGEDLDLDR